MTMMKRVKRKAYIRFNVVCHTLFLMMVISSTSFSETRGSIGAVQSCELIKSMDFSGILDAPTQILESKFNADSAELPSHCDVTGYVSPNVGFTIHLPIDTWNSKFLKVGGGGSVGIIDTASCRPYLKKGYACMASDTGHKSTPSDRKWGFNNIQAEIDYGYRGIHVATLAGKALIEYFYKRQPLMSYFVGCSTGGRQALLEAQRFPWDYDGIIAGAPSVNAPGLFLNLAWGVKVLFDDEGSPLLSRSDVELVHRAAVRMCDMDDGVKDGVIGNPPACSFHPSTLACEAGKTQDCLSESKIAIVEKLYSGPLTSSGEKITAGGTSRGGEMSWYLWYLSNESSVIKKYTQDVFRYSAFLPDPGPNWVIRELNFDRDHKRIGMMEQINFAANPDLRKFKATGGKLLMYMGWNDETAKAAVDYYQLTERAMGGRSATREFYRLFMVPGMNHCSGGNGAWDIDYLSYLEEWVENDIAPDQLLAKKPKNHSKSTQDPSNVEFTRPIFPYPETAVYKGTGSKYDALQFYPATKTDGGM